ncbi:MAG: hypothetical protein IPO21_01825 [Bacteroidales bacterium]|nr:hypothetical protein [Bacteroidales bacterium]
MIKDADRWGLVSKNIYNKIFLIIIILCSLSFFELKGIGKADRIIQLLGVGLIFFFILLYTIYGERNQFVKLSFANPMYLLFLGIFISTLGCAYFKNQPIHVTIYQQRHTYFLLFYFLLPYLYPEKEWLIKVVIYMALTAALVYIAQYFAYPARITEAKMFVDRGTLRINLPGFPFIYLGFFLAMDYFFRTSKMFYGLVTIILLITGLLSGFRSVLALFVGLTCVNLLIGSYVKNRLLIIFVCVILGMAGYFAFQGIIDEMRTSAERETSQGEDYIRVKAGYYYLDEMNKNKMSYISGYGEPSDRSSYGHETSAVSLSYGYYLSDVGIIGTYYKFGLLFCVTMLFILLKLLFYRHSTELRFMKFYIIMQLVLITIGFFFSEGGEGAVILSILLYLTDIERSKSISHA